MLKRVFNSSLSIALVILVTVAIPGIACDTGGEAPPVSTPTAPGGNQPPVISSLTPTQTQVYPSGNTEIKCVASDPDGDQINFKWACTAGSFSDSGPTAIVWKAPKDYGDYQITVIVEDGKGGIAQASLTISVTANQSPQISSLVPDSSTILPGRSAKITCIATDPDGDDIRYSWSASDGSVSGVGEKVTWVAPMKGGTYEITVLVSDGKGGETTGKATVTVSSATKTVTLNVVQEETGTVSSTGDKDKSRTMAGDDIDNVGYHAFWSFNTWSLQGTDVKDAKLNFTTRTVAGNPFPSTTGLKGLLLRQAKYGEKLPDFQYIGRKLDLGGVTLYEPPTEVDVTHEIRYIANGALTRFQLQALFTSTSNGNGVAEWIEWSEVTITVTYSEK